MIIFLKRGNFVENQGHIKLQLNNANMLNLTEQADGTDENMFLKAVNGQDGCEVTLEGFGFSLCYHRDNYDFANMWGLMSTYSPIDSDHIKHVGTEGLGWVLDKIPQSSTLIGDINQDGLADILDVVQIIQRIISGAAGEVPGGESFSEEEIQSSDFNEDGLINILDVVQLVNQIINGESSQSAEFIPINYLGHSKAGFSGNTNTQENIGGAYGYAGESSYVSNGDYLSLNPVWTTPNVACEVTIPCPNSFNPSGSLAIKTQSESNGLAGYFSNYGISFDNNNLPSWKTSQLNEIAQTSFSDHTPYKDFVFGFRLGVRQNGELLFPIHAEVPNNWNWGEYNSLGSMIYQPYSVEEGAPEYNFEISVSTNESFSAMGDNGVGSIDIQISSPSDFSGTINLYALDEQDDLVSISDSTGLDLDEFDQAQFGEANCVSSINILAGETKTVSVEYSSNVEAEGQEDYFSFIAEMASLDQSQYYDFPNESQEQLDLLEPNQKTAYLDRIYVPYNAEIIDSSFIQDEIQPLENFGSNAIYEPGYKVIQKPCDIIFHLLEQELGYDKNIDTKSLNNARTLDSYTDPIFFDVSSLNTNDFIMAFSLEKQKDAKKLISEIAKSSKIIPTLANDKLKFISLRNFYWGGTKYWQDVGSTVTEDVFLIKRNDIISYKFSRTSIDNLLTEVELKYNYDKGLGQYLKSTKAEVDENYFYCGTQASVEKKNYYGVREKSDWSVDHLHTNEVYESQYIRHNDGGDTARTLANYNLSWNQNQHNILDISLPVKYFNLEVGDLIEFDKMILDKKIYGEKYVLEDIDEDGIYQDMPIRCGQYILPLWIITKVRKNIEKAQVTIVQLHHLDRYKNLRWKGVDYPSPFPVI